jgi:hypothetical protein
MNAKPEYVTQDDEIVVRIPGMFPGCKCPKCGRMIMPNQAVKVEVIAYAKIDFGYDGSRHMVAVNPEDIYVTHEAC